MAQGSQWRIVAVALGTLLLFSLLVVQFYRLQVVEHPEWSQRAQKQHEGIVHEPFLRGTFWSNVDVKSGHPAMPQALVYDVPKFHLHIDPDNIPQEHRETIGQKLFQIGNVAEEKKPHLAHQFQKRSRNRRLMRWLDREVRDDILKWWLGYAREHRIARNALFFVGDTQRSYPFGSLLGQCLHTIRDLKDEETKQGVPTGGLEAYFNDFLKGHMGRRRILRSPRHHLAKGNTRGDLIEPSEDGADIYLTINHVLQAIAEEEIEVGVLKSEAKTGWAIAMNPHTGEILSFAQYPPFNPADYRSYFNAPEKIRESCVQGVTYPFEPGSPMKPLNLALYLTANELLAERKEALLFDPAEMLSVSDGKVPGRKRPLRDVRAYSHLNMHLGLQKSSNVYMGKIAQRLVERMGAAWYAAALRERFGFGSKTGIELPGETEGFVPAVGRPYPSGAPQWSGSTPYSLAMGYNLLASSIQMMRAYTAIANGGLLVQPTLVKRIVRHSSAGAEKIVYSPEERLATSPPPRVLTPAVAKQVMLAMKYVTKPGGSSQAADIPGFSEAGKSGTTEKIVDGTYSRRTHFSSFIGFTPARENEEVQLLIGIFIDEPAYRYIPGVGTYHFGGKCAAAVFRELAKRSLEYLGVAPDDPHGYPSGDPRRNSEFADWQVEADQLREIYDQWNAPAR